MDLSNALSCPVCLDIFETPLFLPCSHNLCKKCLEPLLIKVRGKDRFQFSCPECRHKMVVTSVNNLKVNRGLQGIIEQYRNNTYSFDFDKESQENSLCEEHGCENLRYVNYCVDCEAPVCYKCMAFLHKSHNTKTLEESWKERQKSFQSSLKKLEAENVGMEVFLSKLRYISKEVKTNGEGIKQKILSECDKLVQIIEEKKREMVTEIEEEQDAKLLSLKEQITENEMKIKQIAKQIDFAKCSLNSDLATRLKACQAMEDRITKDAKEHSVLMPVTTPDFTPIIFDISTERAVLSDMYFVKAEKLGPTDDEICEIVENYTTSSSLADTFSSLFNLRSIDKGIEFQFHVQTAHKNLKVGTSGLSVSHDRVGADERCMDIPSSERFTKHPVVFGNVGISHGRHYWEVTVSKSIFCRVGVAYPNLPRDHGLGDNAMSWCFEKYLETRNVIHGVRTKALEAPPCLFNRLGIYLDYNRGKVAFFNASTKKHLFTFHTKFVQAVCPAFEVNKGEMTISTGLQIPEYVAEKMGLPRE
ncbi:E3 ubiquitin-protein ligase Midline-1-like [Ptychodera flava]|uniref:E3 ubiquitin-protein ligase Midline-1-like n=1 Tax=Ptychodera flava TaxID=63121 RepID=UPI00396A37FA